MFHPVLTYLYDFEKKIFCGVSNIFFSGPRVFVIIESTSLLYCIRHTLQIHFRTDLTLSLHHHIVRRKNSCVSTTLTDPSSDPRRCNFYIKKVKITMPGPSKFFRPTLIVFLFATNRHENDTLQNQIKWRLFLYCEPGYFFIITFQARPGYFVFILFRDR